MSFDWQHIGTVELFTSRGGKRKTLSVNNNCIGVASVSDRDAAVIWSTDDKIM